MRILSCYTGKLLLEVPGENLRGANLREANLHGANLSGANLHGANLHGANLHGAKITETATLIGSNPLLSINPIGSRDDVLFAFVTNEGLKLKTGCFNLGTRQEFLESLQQSHQDDEHTKSYHAALVLIDLHYERNLN
jgi:hypothetical protein